MFINFADWRIIDSVDTRSHGETTISLVTRVEIPHKLDYIVRLCPISSCIFWYRCICCFVPLHNMYYIYIMHIYIYIWIYIFDHNICMSIYIYIRSIYMYLCHMWLSMISLNGYRGHFRVRTRPLQLKLVSEFLFESQHVVWGFLMFFVPALGDNANWVSWNGLLKPPMLKTNHNRRKTESSWYWSSPVSSLEAPDEITDLLSEGEILYLCKHLLPFQKRTAACHPIQGDLQGIRPEDEILPHSCQLKRCPLCSILWGDRSLLNWCEKSWGTQLLLGGKVLKNP